MKARWMAVAATLLFAAGCGNSGSGSGAPASSGGPAKAAQSGAPGAGKSADAKPGGGALANPEENYVAAATKIGCAGVELDGADAFAKLRGSVLAEHGYTEDTWKAASKQYGASKGEAIVKAMEGKCPN